MTYYIPYIEITSTDIQPNPIGNIIPVYFTNRFMHKVTRMLPPTPICAYYPTEYIETLEWYDEPIPIINHDGLVEIPPEDISTYSYKAYPVPIQSYAINIIHDDLFSDQVSVFRPFEDMHGTLILIGNKYSTYYTYTCAILKAIMSLYNIYHLPSTKEPLTTNFGLVLTYDTIKEYHKNFWDEEMPESPTIYTKDHYKLLSTYVRCFSLSDYPIESVMIDGKLHNPTAEIPK